MSHHLRISGVTPVSMNPTTGGESMRKAWRVPLNRPRIA